MVVENNCKSNESAKSNCINCRRSQKGIAKLTQTLVEFNSQNSYLDRLHKDDALFERVQFNPSMKVAAESKLTRGNED